MRDHYIMVACDIVIDHVACESVSCCAMLTIIIHPMCASMQLENLTVNLKKDIIITCCTVIDLG